MEKEIFKKNLIQIGVLILAYYIIPPIVADFIGVTSDFIAYIPLIVEALIGGLLIYTLLGLKTPIEEKIKEIIVKLSKKNVNAEVLDKVAEGIIMLLYVILISLVALPIIKVFVSDKLVSIVKVAIVIYCLYQIYRVWDSFNDKKN